ncbi:MAG: histidinol phosphatase [Dyadobacter sp.]|uniref:tyrosine-protein phosphatase n=1 Tax=Dyadobacter sp. TaxID=1914288 RepID=UPI001B08CC90|nr:CpsB/CapC family capsule biosynthesis tyrosine phosphatase [Dyadobacter sp.]MBO9616387.1 histidinol phosphatase [Dyadobacter sp.]
MLSWLFGKSKTAEIVQLDRIGIDIHSHLIPGIDDGVETVEESIEMILKMKELGYSHIITTPHVIWDCYRNTPDIIRQGLKQVRDACRDANIEVNVQAAAEYFIDEHFVEMLSKGEELLTLPGKRLLVELPYSTPLMNTSETLFGILAKGYQPVLAHPERYTYFHSQPEVFQKLVAQGCELQVNVLSLSSYYGPNVQKMANWLLEKQLVSFLGSDAHKMGHLDMISKCDKNGWLSKYPFQNEKLVSK